MIEGTHRIDKKFDWYTALKEYDELVGGLYDELDPIDTLLQLKWR